MKKMSPDQIIQKKDKKEKIVALTAYDCPTAAILDQVGIDLVLVGDSVGMVLLGYESTLPVTMEQMLHHVKAVAAGVRSSLVVADMPFMSYQASCEQAILNAGRFIQEAGAQAVKLEGGAEFAETVRGLVRAGIPCMGHIGLKPQQVLKKGKYEVQGKTESQKAQLIEDAQALEESGIFALVLEGVAAEVAKEITGRVQIPTIGIGAGPHCDGQILVLHDLLGIGSRRPKFVKVYAELGQAIEKAVQVYQKEVREGTFPDATHSY